jgi:hypothetical protein
MYDAENTLFALAADFIQYTNRSVFLTGKAGTGKTTFLKYIRQSTIKQTAIVAPTGVAAINAGGVTTHSFFQLPFTPFIPNASREDRNTGSRQEGTDGGSSSGPSDFRSSGPSDSPASIDKHALIGRIKLNGERRKVLQQLELLVIDEISMVRCDVLDAIDAVLRHFRNRYHEPFGGVQLLFIGDMFQLPPVVPNEEWGILSQFYNSPYFFDSRVIAQQEPVHIELNKIYRQNEQHFIDLLNKFRGVKPPPAPVPVIKPERAVILVTREQKSGMTTEEREDLIINLVFNNGQLSADELAGALNLCRDQALIDINRLVRDGVLAVVPDGAIANKSYEIVRGEG